MHPYVRFNQPLSTEVQEGNRCMVVLMRMRGTSVMLCLQGPARWRAAWLL